MSEAAKSDFLVRIRTAVSIEEIDAAIRAIPVNNEPIGERYVVAVVRLEERKNPSERVADALEDISSSLKTQLTQQNRILELTERLRAFSSECPDCKDYQDYIKTISLNVPLPYRQPQLDLSMVRMRTAIDQIKNVIKSIREESSMPPIVGLGAVENGAIRAIQEQIAATFEEALTPK